LEEIMTVWADLPEYIKAAIMALVRSVDSGLGGDRVG
jgi:hypothetical protein